MIQGEAREKRKKRYTHARLMPADVAHVALEVGRAGVLRVVVARRLRVVQQVLVALQQLHCYMYIGL